jgi:hypothetical protein
LAKKKKDTTRRSAKSDSTVATSQPQDETQELDQFREDLKKEIIDIISPKIDEGFDRITKSLGQKFVSREEYEHEQTTNDHSSMKPLPNEQQQQKLPDLSGLAEVVANFASPSNNSPSPQDIAMPQDQQQNPMQNLMGGGGNPIMNMIMQMIMKPDVPQNSFTQLSGVMPELMVRSMIANMNNSDMMNKMFMQVVAKAVGGNIDLSDSMKTHDHLMNPLTKLGSKSEQADLKRKLEESKQ